MIKGIRYLKIFTKKLKKNTMASWIDNHFIAMHSTKKLTDTVCMKKGNYFNAAMHSVWLIL